MPQPAKEQHKYEASSGETSAFITGLAINVVTMLLFIYILLEHTYMVGGVWMKVFIPSFGILVLVEMYSVIVTGISIRARRLEESRMKLRATVADNFMSTLYSYVDSSSIELPIADKMAVERSLDNIRQLFVKRER